MRNPAKHGTFSAQRIFSGLCGGCMAVLKMPPPGTPGVRSPATDSEAWWPQRCQQVRRVFAARHGALEGGRLSLAHPLCTLSIRRTFAARHAARFTSAEPRPFRGAMPSTSASASRSDGASADCIEPRCSRAPRSCGGGKDPYYTASHANPHTALHPNKNGENLNTTNLKPAVILMTVHCPVAFLYCNQNHCHLKPAENATGQCKRAPDVF